MNEKPLFEKVLIANRGEIAYRIIKTLRKMGIKSVAVYSEADTNSLYVKEADEAVFVGPSVATESYLSIPRIIEAVRKSGAQAVHPGYGFLSENRHFAIALKNEGVKLIGPNAYAIEAMGDKIEAKKIADAAKVSTVPGYSGVIKTPKEAVKIAKKLGFPVIVKAAAGGGGKGMRVVYTPEEMESNFKSATREAASNFSDGRVFVEKFVEHPRHIEIQVLADEHGNIVCLGERECSIQRHHQKVIEEAPSPFVTPKIRERMYKQVRQLVNKVGYYSAGTVEFIMDQERNFYFLEMNTRLQVEHCVTELVTGIDIVEQMIRIAAGEKLSFTQDDVELNGWAIESRIYAEDPSRGFLPSSGRIIEYKEPMLTQNIRIDSGVEAGGEVSMFYDAMISKLCTYAPTRIEAIEHMKKALGDYVIRGIAHNMSFLESVMAHPKFVSGDISTDFIGNQYPDGYLGSELTNELTQIFLAVGVYIYLLDTQRALTVSGASKTVKHIGSRWIANIDGQLFPVITKPTTGGVNMRQDRKRINLRSNWVLGSSLFKGEVNDTKVSVKIEHLPSGGYQLTHAGRTVKIAIRSPRVAELESFMPVNTNGKSSKHLTAPIAGMMLDVKVKKGDKVKAGQEIVTIEAMKMENIIYAEADCVVQDVLVSVADSVSVGQVLVEFE